MISILILTLNEESNLKRCLEAIRWSDDIHVLDSGSTDRTVQLANEAGAHVSHHPFQDFASQQNWAVDHIKFKHPWVYYTDADEVLTPELSAELRAIASGPPSGPVAYRLRYKNYFEGGWIRHCGVYPVWIMRFFRLGKVKWERSGHGPHPVVDGQEGRLRGHFEHYSFSKGMDEWWAKHRIYAAREAEEAVKLLATGGIRWRGLISFDAMKRRRALKELSFRLPFRPTLRFLYMYIVRLGFLDGTAGYRYCRLLARYERLIVDNMKALRRPQPPGRDLAGSGGSQAETHK